MTVYEASLLRGDARADGVETLEVRFVDPRRHTDLEIADWLRVVLRDEAFEARR